MDAGATPDQPQQGDITEPVNNPDDCQKVPDKDSCIKEKMDQSVTQLQQSLREIKKKVEVICRNSPTLCEKMIASFEIFNELKPNKETAHVKSARQIAERVSVKIANIAIKELQIEDKEVQRMLAQESLKAATDAAVTLASESPASIKSESLEPLLTKACERASQKAVEDYYVKLIQQKESMLARVKADKLLETLLN